MDHTTSAPGGSDRGLEANELIEGAGVSDDEATSTLPPGAGAPIGPPPAPVKRQFQDATINTENIVRPLDPHGPPTTDHYLPAEASASAPHTIHPVVVPPRRDRGASLLVGIISGVLGASLAVGGLAVAGIFDRPETIVEQITAPAQPTQIIIEGGATNTAAAVALKVVPSIVAVEVAADISDDTFDAFASGSGVVLSSDGFIVTNHHVIADADLAQIVLQSGVIYQARVIGSDPITDLAVLQIDAPGLAPIELGSSSDLAIGDQAVAVGNPLGLPGGASVTVGVVSAFDREVTVGNGLQDRLFGMVQTDAPITRGSSGGALVDSEGRLIGITTAIGVTDAGAEGVGFAIPVELVTRITDEIIERGFVRHTFLGVLLQDHFENVGGAQIPNGALIVDFVDPSGARDAGLEIGDRLTVINGRTVKTKEDIINELREFRVGDNVPFELVRDGSTINADVILGERPDDA